MFSGSHVQINDGNFVNVGGDFNFESIQAPGSVDEGLMELEFGFAGRQLAGAERTDRGLSTRMIPYDVSHRRRIMADPDNAYEQERGSNSNNGHTQGAYIANSDPFSLPDHLHEQVHQLEFHWLSTVEEPAGYLNGDPGLDLDPSGMDTWAIGTDLDFSAILSIPSPQNSGPSHDFSLTTTSQIRALEYPPDWTDSASASHDAVENEYFPTQYHSTNSDAGSSQRRYPVEPMSGMIDNHLTFPWKGPSSAPATSIHGGTFIGGNVQNIQRHGKAGLHILHRATASDAFYDSAERFPQPRCHPETRTELLNVLWSWTCGIKPPKNWTSDNFALSSEEDNGPSSRILWLYGPAGAGKSAVAQSFCQKLKDEGRLGGSFFFKRGHSSRGNAHKLFPTIAYQLALHLPQLNQLISQRIERDPAIVDRSLSDQLHQLIIEPCRKTSFPQSVTVIIDGLDECDGEDIQQEILRSIGHVVRQERLPILFFFASRPESYIRETFVSPCLEGFHRPLNIEQSFQDVRRYLLVELGRIRREHQTTMAKVPSPWPQSEIVEKLVQKSSGYFIYASTVVKFIDDKRFRPVDRLDIILGIKNSISRSPFDALDQLYQQILCGVPIDFHPQLLGILTVITARLDLWVSVIEQLLELEMGDVRLILRGLHSVIDIPAEEDAKISAHHASFLDFLHDSSRSGPFYVGSSQCRHNLTHHILKTLSFQTPDLLTDLGHPGWHLESDAFEYITSAEPCPTLLPLVQSLNPDLLFNLTSQTQLCIQFVHWLKKFNPLPEDLIHLWEDYTFIVLCDRAWDGSELLDEHQLDKRQDMVSHASPQLLRVLYACRLFPKIQDETPFRLLQFRDLFGLSWDELRSIICPLRALIGDESARLHELLTFNLDATLLGKLDPNSFVLELAKCGLRVMVDEDIYYPLRCLIAEGWGFFLRSCPPAPDLLQSLSQIDLPSTDDITLEDIHNIVQWLMTYPHSPIELIARFEHYLEMKRYSQRYMFDRLEKTWIQWCERHKGFLNHSTVPA